MSPVSRSTRWTLAWAHYVAGEFDDAGELLFEVLRLDPAFAPAHELLGDIAQSRGDAKAALGHYQQALLLAGFSFDAAASLADALESDGVRGLAARRLGLRDARDPGGAEPVWAAAQMALAADNDAAFAWLDRAYAARRTELVWLEVHPAFAALRGDPRYRALARRVGLSQEWGS